METAPAGGLIHPMPTLPIRFYDDPVLRQTARPIASVEPRHRELAANMAETMYEASGIGLAANQVGVLERIIIVDTGWPRRADDDEQPLRRPRAMINPEVLQESDQDDAYEEGCLSLPGINGDVWRSIRIRYRYTDLDGQTHEAEAQDLEARCILHEIDHLNGVLFIDRMTTQARRALAGKLQRLRRSQETA